MIFDMGKNLHLSEPEPIELIRFGPEDEEFMELCREMNEIRERIVLARLAEMMGVPAHLVNVK